MGSCPTTKKSSSRSTEKRRERSKVAARCRRGKESEIFSELASTLPISESTRSSLDKASIMRLSLCHLRLREIMETEFICETPNANEKDAELYNSLLSDALGGFILILTAEGDFIYSSAPVGNYLGLSEIELMKCSIFEFTHAEDHKEIKEILSTNKNDTDAECSAPRTASFRMKCTVTARGRSVHMRSATYKVVNYRGRMFGNSKDQHKRWFGGVAEILPHPSDVDIPLNKQTFLSKHSLDLKFAEVDESIYGFLGYEPEDLIGKSFFEFLNFSKDEVTPLSKVFTSLHSKGQAITEIYRFLAKHGGWVWVRTLATVLYANHGSTPTSIVCLHFIASGVEHANQIVSDTQTCGKSDTTVANSEEINDDILALPASTNEMSLGETNGSILNNPIASTRKVFTRKTEDMDKGFLIPFDNRMIESKDDQEDLTHLAPMAGDECVQLDPPMLDDLLETLEQSDIEYRFDGLVVNVNADELPPFCNSSSEILRNGDYTNNDSKSGRDSSVSMTLTPSPSCTSPLFLHSDPHMTLSPDTKSLLSPFQNPISNECESGGCHLDQYSSSCPEQSKSCNSLCLPIHTQKSKTSCFHSTGSTSELLHVFISPTASEETWQCLPSIRTPEKRDSDALYSSLNLERARHSPLESDKVSSDIFIEPVTIDCHTASTSGMDSFVENLSCEVSPNEAVEKCDSKLLTSINLINNHTTHLIHGKFQCEDLIDDNSKWKAKSIPGTKNLCDEIIHMKDPKYRYPSYCINTKRQTVPPEIARKKDSCDLNSVEDNARVHFNCIPAISKESLYDTVVTPKTIISKNYTNPNAKIVISSTSNKRRKLINCDFVTSNSVNITEKRTDSNGIPPTNMEQRKRNFLGRLLCCSSSNEAMSFCELTRQDYEVNAPLGDNCCLLQGPDILNALDAGQFNDPIL